MTIFIEGVAFPLGVINANGWGIPFAEADNAIKSLKTSVVRICSRVDPHICDYMEDPFSEIGHVVDAWRDGDDIVCKAEITDSQAVQKIEDGTWKTTWSVFAYSDETDSGGWAHNIIAKSITIVDNPAWEQSQWSVTASKDGGKQEVRKISQFKLIASSQNKEGGQLTPEEELENLKKEIEEKDGKITELGEQAGKVEGLEKQVGELGASVKDLENKLKEKETLVASLEKKEAGSVPMEKVKELIASAIAEHDTEQATLKANAEAREAFVAARKALGMETKTDQFTALTASEFKEMTETLAVKLSASGKPTYPANNVSDNTTATGAYDGKLGDWVK